jgi:NADH-quinone oxidoreductase subunit M
MHTRQIADYGGVVNTMQKFAALVMLFSMANCGLPGTSGFVGEFMVILAAVQYNFWIAFGAAFTLILGAGYTLWMYKRVYFGAVGNDHVKKLIDINGREFFMLIVLAALTLFMGLYPKPFSSVMHASVENLLTHVSQSKLPLSQ